MNQNWLAQLNTYILCNTAPYQLTKIRKNGKIWSTSLKNIIRIMRLGTACQFPILESVPPWGGDWGVVRGSLLNFTHFIRSLTSIIHHFLLFHNTLNTVLPFPITLNPYPDDSFNANANIRYEVISVGFTFECFAWGLTYSILKFFSFWQSTAKFGSELLSSSVCPSSVYP